MKISRAAVILVGWMREVYSFSYAMMKDMDDSERNCLFVFQ